MKASSTKNFFQPRARLLLQLGDKLIKNENVALLELIKNSYDADAKKVTVKLDMITDKKHGRIDITDDGEGMNIDIIENVWLEPGSDYKAQLLAKKQRSPKYKRLPIGEKGIGRFGVHKLGNKIELISRKEGEDEVVVRIDWNKFGEEKYLKDAKFEVFIRTPEYFLRNRKGTRIIISDLRNDWDKRMVRDLYKAVFTLNSPFKKSGNFDVEVKIDDQSLIEGLPTFEDIRKFALWHFKCKLSGTTIKDFEYEFTPWESLLEVESRKVTQKDDYIQDNETFVKKDPENSKKEIVINLAKNYGSSNAPAIIGEIGFEGYIFDRDKQTLELGNQAGITLLKQYLDEQGGIRVYRDNVRINEYGEKGNDWLNLDMRRVNVPAKRISNNLVLAVIDLKIEESNALIEKTNREGFIENEAFYDFCGAILYTINIIETLRKNDKDLIRNKYNPTEQEEPVLHHLNELQELIEKRIEDIPLKDEINKHLKKIEEDYNYINETLLTSAGAGLTLAVGIHEVQKVIAELTLAAKKEHVPSKIQDLVDHLDQLIESYSDLLKQADTKEEDAVKFLNGATFNVSYRMDAHKIELIKAYKEYKGSIIIESSRRLLMGAVMNIIDNSIYWLEVKKKRLLKTSETFEKKIFIDIIQTEPGYLDIIIADNGSGFTIPKFQITKPFITAKTSGIGLGLHIVAEVMKVQGGAVRFPEADEYVLPEEFQRGAITVLKTKLLSHDTSE
jgi:signal transduction histidine kinase